MPFQTFDHYAANLQRKYGENAKSIARELAHQRLRSWGLNTIGNWSSTDIYLQRKTPYTATVHVNTPPIEGSEGYWRQFPDPFAPTFRTSVRKAITYKKDSFNDPWCIGFFVDNELSWGDDTSLAVATLKSPAKQPAKQAFIERLKKRHSSIDQLNSAWGTNYASWEAFSQDSTFAPTERSKSDLKQFYSLLSETYFRIINEELKAVAPNHLYLGCRFAWVNDAAVRAAAKHCDVISFNKYDYTVNSIKLPDGINKPIIIGEFHFGALDRGMFHTGLRSADNQDDRADCYRRYIQSALDHPQIVGAHWFQYIDQPTTGRGDGENYQIGLLNICDTPYPEMIKAIRETANRLYPDRMSK